MPTTRVSIPQMIDPSLDYMVFSLLRSLKLDLHVRTGLKTVRHLLLGAYVGSHRLRAPRIILMCTNPAGLELEQSLDAMRTMALACNIPTIHSLTRSSMGQACGIPYSVSAIAIMDVPPEAEVLLAAVMQRAAEAYADYVKLSASGRKRLRHRPEDPEDLLERQRVELLASGLASGMRALAV